MCFRPCSPESLITPSVVCTLDVGQILWIPRDHARGYLSFSPFILILLKIGNVLLFFPGSPDLLFRFNLEIRQCQNTNAKYFSFHFYSTILLAILYNFHYYYYYSFNRSKVDKEKQFAFFIYFLFLFFLFF